MDYLARAARAVGIERGATDYVVNYVKAISA
jgi:hypothetical protein